MASFFSSPTFLSHPITKTTNQIPSASSSSQPQISPVRTQSEASDDWISTTLTRRAGLASASLLAITSLSQKLNTQQQTNTRYRNVDKEEQVILPNGIRYYELKVGDGACARGGDMVVIEVKGKVESSKALFVGTLEGGKKPLAVLMGSRPYSKGICEGIECVLRTMKVGGKRKVIIPPSLGYGEDGTDLGSGFHIPPASTLEYVIEVQNVSIPSA